MNFTDHVVPPESAASVENILDFKEGKGALREVLLSVKENLFCG